MISFTSFFASENPDAIEEYSSYMRVGVEALKITNPGARYVILTDRETAPHLNKIAEVAVVAPSNVPLMLQFMRAQANWERSCTDSMSVLAEPDCIANRSLVSAMSKKHGLAVTYREHIYPINNVAYVQDHSLAAWYLDRASTMALDYGPEMAQWFGDQIAWDEALKPWHIEEDKIVQEARPGGRLIHLYPCITHNHMLRQSGQPKKKTGTAYIVNFKGDRKVHMQTYLKENLHGSEII